MAKAIHLGVATTNPGKLREFKDLLEPAGFILELAPSDFDVDEIGATFEANAQLKAEALMQRTHKACIADDSGLVVDALGGAPGMYSARYSGETRPALRDAANRTRLLREMHDVDAAQRSARYVCVIAYVTPSGASKMFTGCLEGHIATSEQGSGGFGYDSVFIPQHHTDSMAQVPRAQRYAISHRAQALRKLHAWLSSG